MKIIQRQHNRKQVNSLILTGTNNAVKCSKGKNEGLSHRIVKFWLAEFCWEKGIDFATEVVFNDHQRADFVVKDLGIIIEILGSEKISDFKKKRYPLPTIPLPFFISVENIYNDKHFEYE